MANTVGSCAKRCGNRSGSTREYPDPSRGFEALKDHVAFYPERVDACFVDDEIVKAQDGGFYGGWITSEIVGPFKGAAGTRGW